MRYPFWLTVIVLATLLSARVESYAGPVVIYGNYYESSLEVNCASPNNNFCPMSFPDSPSGKFLLVKRLSCYVNASAILRNGFFGNRLNGNDFDRNFAVALPLPISANGTNYYLINAEMSYLVAPNTTPFFNVTAAANATFNLRCSLFGELV